MAVKTLPKPKAAPPRKPPNGPKRVSAPSEDPKKKQRKEWWQ